MPFKSYNQEWLGSLSETSMQILMWLCHWSCIVFYIDVGLSYDDCTWTLKAVSWFLCSSSISFIRLGMCGYFLHSNTSVASHFLVCLQNFWLYIWCRPYSLLSLDSGVNCSPELLWSGKPGSYTCNTGIHMQSKHEFSMHT